MPQITGRAGSLDNRSFGNGISLLGIPRRSSDVLLKVYSPRYGDFLLVNEIQLRYRDRMPRRMRAYTALAEEWYNLPVYLVLVHILPIRTGIPISTRYESNFLEVEAVQDYRVINLSEVKPKSFSERDSLRSCPSCLY